LVCHLFVVFIPPTAAYFYLWLAMLSGSAADPDPSEALPVPRRAWLAYAVAVMTGLVLTIYATRLMVSDAALATVRRALESGQIEQAAEAYQTVLAWQPKGTGADLYYSRGMADLAARATLPSSHFLAWSQAVEAGKRAASSAEDRPNACYSLAALLAVQNDSAGAEQSLPNAIAAAPNWYKPHWTLARLLSLTGRNAEALAEASAAVERGGGRHAEVLDTLTQLKQKNAQNP
jgi:tetratricopeptide (TPR) repeat protein